MRTGLQQQDIAGFFDAHVAEMQEKGVFKDYDEPKGTPVEGHNPMEKMTHSGSARKNTRGMRFHRGDQTFDRTLSDAFYMDPEQPNELQATQQEVSDKMLGVYEAIKTYVPEDKFGVYLRYFAENLDDPKNRKSLDIALSNMAQQFTDIAFIKSNPFMDADTFDLFISSKTTETRLKHADKFLTRDTQPVFPDGRPNMTVGLRAIDCAPRTVAMQNAPEHPEMLLALAIYQAAHIGFRDELADAINRGANETKDTPARLSPEEHDNASSVALESLRQFQEFLIFRTLAPIILHERKKLVRDPESAGLDASTSSDTFTRAAITKGWESFFKGGFLKSDVISDGAANAEDYDEKRLIVVCPANAHLRATQKFGLIETLFDSITNHREQLSGLIQETQRYAERSLKGEYPQELLTYSGLSKTAYHKRINRRALGLGLDPKGNTYPRAGIDPEIMTQKEIGELMPVMNKVIAAAREADEHNHMVIRMERLQESFLSYVSAKELQWQGSFVKIPSSGENHIESVSDFSIEDVCRATSKTLNGLVNEDALRQQMRDALPERARERFDASKPLHVTARANKSHGNGASR